MTVTSDYVREIFRGLRYADGPAFFANVADDVDWSVVGAHPFAGDYRGKGALVAGTFAKMAQVLPQGAQLHVEHLVVEDNQALVGLHALVAVKNGMRFDNHYCWIVFFRGGEIVGVRGYPDSVMITQLKGLHTANFVLCHCRASGPPYVSGCPHPRAVTLLR